MLQDNQELYSRSILNGKRWDQHANQTYVMPADVFHQKFDDEDVKAITDVVQKFVERHSTQMHHVLLSCNDTIWVIMTSTTGETINGQ